MWCISSVWSFFKYLVLSLQSYWLWVTLYLTLALILNSIVGKWYWNTSWKSVSSDFTMHSEWVILSTSSIVTYQPITNRKWGVALVSRMQVTHISSYNQQPVSKCCPFVPSGSVMSSGPMINRMWVTSLSISGQKACYVSPYNQQYVRQHHFFLPISFMSCDEQHVSSHLPFALVMESLITSQQVVSDSDLLFPSGVK